MSSASLLQTSCPVLPLTCSYAQQLAQGIGMSKERAAVISGVIRVVLTRRMTYAY